MNATRVLTALIISAVVTACNTPQPKPVTPTQAFGTLELRLADDTNGVRLQAVQPDSILNFDIANAPASVVTDDGTFRYAYRTFSFTNTTSTALTNVTLYAYNQAANSAGGTAIKALSNFTGGSLNNAINAQKLLPTHGMFGNGIVTVVAGREDLQVFDSSEVSSLQTAARAFTPTAIIGANDSVLEYGFVARSLATGGGRSIGASTCNTTTDANCNKGQVTVAYKFPVANAVANTGYGFTATFVLATETIARVTRSPEENDASANTRASSLTATQVVLGGVASMYTGTQIPLANAKISTTPALLLEPSCAGAAILTPIYDIQGSGAATTLTGSKITEGVVVGDFQSTDTTGLQGFYIQDRYGDGNTNTSDAIFVDQSTSTPDTAVSVGDFVRVTGIVGEAFGQTRIEPTNISACGTRVLPATIRVTFPLPTGQSDLEKYEGMLVQIPTELTVTELFRLGEFGQATLSSGGLNNETNTDNRLDQFTQFNAPNAANFTTYKNNNSRRSLVVDDGRADSNPPVNLLGRGGNPLTASNTLRGGDTITDLTGIINFSFSAYRIQPTAPTNFQAVNPRPTAPTVGGTLRVASFNVLNFFTTLNQATFTPANCSNSIAARGAEDSIEFTRQKAKIIQAILAIDPDVLGVIEMQNNGTTAIDNLVAELNTSAGAGTYSTASAPTNGYGCDAIKVDFIYKPSKVNLGSIVSPDDTVYTSFSSSGTGRKPVAATFTQISNGAVFTAVMNHFKSKGSAAAGAGNTDAGDGQGNSNALRVQNSTDLKNWLATNPTGTTDPDYLLMGDFNAYTKEDPLVVLETAGYTNLNPATSYSYVFDGAWGSLDHAFGSSSLTTQVAGAQKLHINADEPTALDYNTTLDNGTVIKTAAQVISLYAADPYRSSDHDPVVVGLNLGGVANSFSLSAAPLDTSNFVGGTGGIASSTITVTRNAFPAAITFSLEVTPANTGITATFTNDPNTTGTSTMNLIIASSVVAGSYNLVVKGTSGAAVVSSNTLNISVTAACTGLTVMPSSASIAVNATQQLTAAFTPSGCAAPSVVWSNGGSSVATVNSSGLVTGATVGNATITATAGSLTGSSAITVTAASSTTGVVISQVYGGGGNAGTTFRNDFIELKNNGTTAVSVAGWSVQYASATGTAWAVTNLTGSIAPGGYYLVQQAAGTGGTAALPTPNVIGTILMSGTNGKVALVSSTTALSGQFATGTGTNIVDFVGYGTADGREGTAATPALTNTTAAIRNGSGCTDTNNNSANFTVGTPTPRNSSSAAVTCL